MVCLAVGFLLSHLSKSGLRTKVGMLETDRSRLGEELNSLKEENVRVSEERSNYLSRAVSLDEQVKLLEKNIAENQEESRQQQAQLRADAEKRQEELRAEHEKRLAELREQQRSQLNEQLELVKEQMSSATERYLKQRSEELTATNKEQLEGIINPLQEHIKQMREAVDKSDKAQLESMARLDTAIKENLRRAEEVGERADRLALALTGDNKKQGDFGELRLRQLLQNMGLEEGIQYEEQQAMRDADGNVIEDGKYRPDVILHFPDKRDLIIDSKVSLTQYERYFNAETDAEREEAQKAHVASVRQHVKELSEKNYSARARNGKNYLDFVVMYMFNESALQLALAKDRDLWNEAFNQGVMIVSGQNMYALLRLLEFAWKQDRQVKNQREMMDAANTVVERVQLFYERFSKAEEMLKKTAEAFQEVKNSTSPSGKSIATSARNLLKYGAQENTKKKALPKPEDDQTE